MKNFKMPAIAFDFDGVIHTYENGWQDGSIYGRLNQQVLDAIYGFHERGYPIFVFSTRNPQQIVVWLNEHLTDLKAKAISEDTIFFNDTNYIGVTRYKLPAMVYIDDRAYHYCGQSGETIVNDITQKGE